MRVPGFSDMCLTYMQKYIKKKNVFIENIYTKHNNNNVFFILIIYLCILMIK